MRPDGSSQGGTFIYATTKDLVEGRSAPVSILEWKSWKLKRKVRSSLAVESQTMADVIDILNYIRLFMAEFVSKVGLGVRRTDNC